jgi:CheY-like chemotaxis protein
MKHILLLEDHGDVASVLTRLLEEERYYVTSTGLSGIACELLDRVKFDLFVADVLLPDGTAFAALDIAKLDEVPYLLMTGNPGQMAELEANGQFHLSKPFKFSEFMGAVRDRIGSGDDTRGTGRATFDDRGTCASAHHAGENNRNGEN